MEENSKEIEKEKVNSEDSNYMKYLKMTLDEKYQFCIKEYNFVYLNNREIFKKDLHMRYVLDNKTHNFFYDYEQDKFFLNSNEDNTANIINNLNEMIIYIRVHNMGDESINWIHPLYSSNIQYLKNDSDKWESLSFLNN